MKEEIFAGIKYLIGKNAQENWDLLDKSKKINQDYIWFHLNSFPSCYVIMYSTLEELKELKENSVIENNNETENKTENETEFETLCETECKTKSVNKYTVQDYLNFGASLCKENSKYRGYSNLKIIYSPLKKIKKTEKVGEVIISGKKMLLTV